MIKQKDNIHYSLRKIMGYNKAFNAVISEREAGKSTELASTLYNTYKAGGTCLLIRRQIVDITEAYILSLEAIIRKFYDDKFSFYFKKGELSEGVVYIFDDKGKLVFAVIALACKMSRIKSLVLPNIRYIFFDEFICNPRFDEKYLKGEDTRFKEIYNTFYRESDTGIKCFFFGNPYSLYNPYFLWWNVDTKQLKRGNILSGSNWCVECYEITQELRDYILARNPLYEFDDAYRRYAFEGKAINDERIKVEQRPNNFSLRYVFKVEDSYIGVYKNNKDNNNDRFFAEFVTDVSARRCAYCFDFRDLVDGCALLSMQDRLKFASLKSAMRKRDISFSEIAVYYMLLDVYNVIQKKEKIL